MLVPKWTARTFRVEGYGRRYLWLDLVNSLYPDGFGHAVDCLKEERWRAVFLTFWSLRSRAQEALPLESFRSLRASLHVAAVDIVSAGAPSAKTIKTLNEALNEGVVRFIQAGENGYQVALRPVDWSWRWVIAQIAASFAEFLASGEFDRLKMCANSLCLWMFYDETKSCTKRWCDDRRCGNRDKVRRHRARRKLREET